jgi:hypothetical protein
LADNGAFFIKKSLFFVDFGRFGACAEPVEGFRLCDPELPANRGRFTLFWLLLSRSQELAPSLTRLLVEEFAARRELQGSQPITG